MLKHLACTGPDAAVWQNYVNRLPACYQDIMITPQYARVQQEIAGVTYCGCLVYEDGEQFVLQPFTLRDNDICSFHGGGGPVATSHLWVRFDEVASEWRRYMNIISEYAQLLLPCGKQQSLLMGPSVDATETKRAVVVDLTLQDLFLSFSRNRQRGITRSRKDGNKVELVVPDESSLDVFCALYGESLKRLGAEARWNYSRGVWRAYADMGSEYMSLLAQSDSGGRTTAMLLLVHGYGRCYAHFIGWLEGVSHDLLYYEAMRHAQKIGCREFYLGGGTTGAPDDKLLASKLSYSKQTVPVYSYRRIFDQQAYHKLCVDSGIDESATSWFPAYRAKEAA